MTDEMVECKESEMRSEDPIAYLPKLGSVVGSNPSKVEAKF